MTQPLITEDQLDITQLANNTTLQNAFGGGSGSWELVEAWTPTAVQERAFAMDYTIYNSMKVVYDNVAGINNASYVTLRFGRNGTVQSNLYENHEIDSAFDLQSSYAFAGMFMHLSTIAGGDPDQHLNSEVIITNIGSSITSPSATIMSNYDTTSGGNAYYYGTSTHVAATIAGGPYNELYATLLANQVGGYGTFQAGRGEVRVYGFRR